MIAGALLVSVVLATLWALRRTPTDPRAGWSTSAGMPIWFEHSRSGARFMATESAGQIVIGAAADCPVPGTRPRHAQVRIFARDRIDIGPIDGAPVRVAGRRLRGPGWLTEGDPVVLAGVELIAHIGWVPDPSDPRIGTVVAGERLWARLAANRYTTVSHVIQILDPPVDPVAYEVRLRAAQALVRALLPVLRVQADALVVDELVGEPSLWPLTPLSFVALCGLVAPLHAAGLAHGGLDDAVLVTPGELRLWPVAPTGTIADDIAALQRRLPPGWPALPGDDIKALTRAALQHGAAIDAFASWNLSRCVRCGEPFARAERPETTMFDGRDAVTGRSFGGSTTRHRSECLVCGHVEVRIEREAYR